MWDKINGWKTYLVAVLMFLTSISDQAVEFLTSIGQQEVVPLVLKISAALMVIMRILTQLTTVRTARDAPPGG